jgi:hypothetical protein
MSRIIPKDQDPQRRYRKTTAVIVAAVAALALSGCAKANEAPQTSAPQATEQASATAGSAPTSETAAPLSERQKQAQQLIDVANASGTLLIKDMIDPKSQAHIFRPEDPSAAPEQFATNLGNNSAVKPGSKLPKMYAAYDADSGTLRVDGVITDPKHAEIAQTAVDLSYQVDPASPLGRAAAERDLTEADFATALDDPTSSLKLSYASVSGQAGHQDLLTVNRSATGEAVSVTTTVDDANVYDPSAAIARLSETTLSIDHAFHAA